MQRLGLRADGGGTLLAGGRRRRLKLGELCARRAGACVGRVLHLLQALARVAQLGVERLAPLGEQALRLVDPLLRALGGFAQGGHLALVGCGKAAQRRRELLEPAGAQRRLVARSRGAKRRARIDQVELVCASHFLAQLLRLPRALIGRQLGAIGVEVPDDEELADVGLQALDQAARHLRVEGRVAHDQNDGVQRFQGVGTDRVETRVAADAGRIHDIHLPTELQQVDVGLDHHFGGVAHASAHELREVGDALQPVCTDLPHRLHSVGDAHRNRRQRIEGDRRQLGTGQGVEQRRLARLHLAEQRDAHAAVGELGQQRVDIADAALRQQDSVWIERLAHLDESFVQARRKHTVDAPGRVIVHMDVEIGHVASTLARKCVSYGLARSSSTARSRRKRLRARSTIAAPAAMPRWTKIDHGSHGCHG